MQAKLLFQCDNLKLPIHYNNIVQGFIYKNISDDSFREFLHEKGFEYEKRTFKLFTFSDLMGRYDFNRQDKTITFKNEVSLVIGSIVDDFTNDFINSCLKSNDLRLKGQKIKLKGVEIDNDNIENESIVVKTLSPVVTYSTVNIEGSKKTIYYSPNDTLFSKQIKRNLIKKAEAIGYNDYKDRFNIYPLDEKKMRKRITKYKGLIINGWNGLLKIEGDKTLIKIALSCGIGAKNSQGFGCITVL